MTSSASTRLAPRGARTHFALAAVGGAALVGMIPLTAIAGEWWLLGATFAMLVTTATLVVAGLFWLLAQSDDAVAAGREPTPATADVGMRGRRRLRIPVLRSA